MNVQLCRGFAFGLLLATLLVLILVPTLYRIYRDFVPHVDEHVDEYMPDRTQTATA